MDLVGEEDEVMLFAKSRELDHFFFCEDAAEWVLWVTQDEDLALFGDFGFESLPVESPSAILLDMFGGDQLHRGIIVDAEKGGVNGRAS